MLRQWGQRERHRQNKQIEAAVMASGSNMVQKGLRSCRQHKDLWTKIAPCFVRVVLGGPNWF